MAEQSPTPRGWSLPASPATIAVVLLTAVALAIRLVAFGQSLFADELSTAWIVSGNSLGHVLSTVRSNDEITPPLYFVLAWLASKLGSNPDLLRLPSLVAGVATVPLLYLLGRRLAGELAGVIAAAIAVFSPFLIYYSTEARAYSLMVALVAGSTLALLVALESGGWKRWALYAVLSAAAMYSHYTAAFPLAAQLAWAFFARPEARRALILANVGAAVLFAPWIPGYLDDSNSPTTKILSALQPFNLHAVRQAFGNWAVGYPYVTLHQVPGLAVGVVIAAGVVFAGVVVAVRLNRERASGAMRVSSGTVLIAALLLSTPVGEAVYSAIGSNLLGPRGLVASWPGLALALGALLAAVRPARLAAIASTVVIGGFAVGAVRAERPAVTRPDYDGAASYINARAAPGDVVVDGAAVTPGPLTGLQVYLSPGKRLINLGLPDVSHPFSLADPIPDPSKQIQSAIRAARGRRLFLVYAQSANSSGTLPSRALSQQLGQQLLGELPPSDRVVGESTFNGLTPLTVVEIDGRSRRAAGG